MTISAPAPAPDAKANADPFFNLGAVAIPAITGSALIDGLLLGKVAFLKGKQASVISVLSKCAAKASLTDSARSLF